MIKEQATDTLTLGNVSVTETDYCGGKVAVMASDGIYHWCDLCGKAEVACTHDRRYAYGTDARLSRMHGSTAPTPRPGNAASLPRRKPTGTSTTASPMSSGM